MTEFNFESLTGAGRAALEKIKTLGDKAKVTKDFDKPTQELTNKNDAEFETSLVDLVFNDEEKKGDLKTSFMNSLKDDKGVVQRDKLAQIAALSGDAANLEDEDINEYLSQAVKYDATMPTPTSDATVKSTADSTDDATTRLVKVTPWGDKSVPEQNDCLLRIIQNNYSKDIKYGTKEYWNIADKVMAANEQIYAAGRKIVGGNDKDSTVLYTTDTLKLPDLEPKPNADTPAISGSETPATNGSTVSTSSTPNPIADSPIITASGSNFTYGNYSSSLPSRGPLKAVQNDMMLSGKKTELGENFEDQVAALKFDAKLYTQSTDKDGITKRNYFKDENTLAATSEIKRGKELVNGDFPWIETITSGKNDEHKVEITYADSNATNFATKIKETIKGISLSDSKSASDKYLLGSSELKGQFDKYDETVSTEGGSVVKKERTYYKGSSKVATSTTTVENFNNGQKTTEAIVMGDKTYSLVSATDYRGQTSINLVDNNPKTPVESTTPKPSVSTTAPATGSTEAPKAVDNTVKEEKVPTQADVATASISVNKIIDLLKDIDGGKKTGANKLELYNLVSGLDADMLELVKGMYEKSSAKSFSDSIFDTYINNKADTHKFKNFDKQFALADKLYPNNVKAEDSVDKQKVGDAAKVFAESRHGGYASRTDEMKSKFIDSLKGMTPAEIALFKTEYERIYKECQQKAKDEGQVPNETNVSFDTIAHDYLSKNWTGGFKWNDSNADVIKKLAQSGVMN